MPKPYQLALLRKRAQRSAVNKANNIIYTAAVAIVDAVQRHNASLAEVSFTGAAMRTEVDRIVANLADNLTRITATYANAAETATGNKGLGFVIDYLRKDHFGATLVQRSRNYALRFRDDILKFILAASVLGKNWTYLRSAIRTGYRNPYINTIVTKAYRLTGDSRLKPPSYGRGNYMASYKQIRRNVENTIALAWGELLHDRAKNDGAKYFIPHRGSSYPCPICEEHAERVHTMDEPHPPYHNNCVCYVEYKIKI